MASSNNKVWWIIGIVILIIVVVVIIVWVLDVNENKNNSTTYAKLNQACVVNKADSNTVPTCTTGLACIKTTPTNTTGVCKALVGGTCALDTDCAPSNGTCINNVCTTNTNSGGLNQPAPCLNSIFIPVNGICKANSGTACGQTSDCGVYGQQCVVTDAGNPSVKTCTAPKSVGQSCVYNDDCSSLYCDQTNFVCSINQNNEGNYGSTCVYYAPNNDYTNCIDIYDCQRDLANSNNTTTSVGICLAPVSTWPNNTTNRICSSSTNSCIPPSVCYNGLCVFPPENKLSCAASNSSGGCSKGFICDNSTKCIPTSGYPGVGSVWKIVQWIRTTNGQMGSWYPLETLPQPGTRPSFSSYTTNTGTMFIYSTDVSTNTYTSNQYSIKSYYKPYYLVYNGFISVLTLNFINSDNQSHNYIDVPYDIKFIPTTSGIKVGVLVRQYIFSNISPPVFQYRSWWVMLADLDITDINNPILNIYRPSYDVYITNVNIATIPTDFSLDLRSGRFGYNLTADSNYYLKSCPPNTTTDNLAINSTNSFSTQNLVPPITTPIYNLQFLTYAGLTNPGLTHFVSNLGFDISINDSSTIYGSADINKMSVTTYPTSLAEIEIFFTQTFNAVTNLYLVKGSNTVIMPVDVNASTIPNISILDSSVTNQLPNLYLLTTTAS